MWLSKPRRLSATERKVSGAAGGLSLIGGVALLYFGGHGFALLSLVLVLVGAMLMVWAVSGKDF